jgi:hypothetical protein
VDQSTGVGGGEAAPGGLEDPQDVSPVSLRRPRGGGHPLPERLSFDEFHRDEDLSGVDAHVVNRHDVVVVQLRQRLGLALESRTGTVVMAVGSKQLQRDFPIELGIVCGEHDAHGAGTEPRKHHVASHELAADRDRGGRVSGVCREHRPLQVES